nr:MAG TPA: hypothetical protein [Caudoviricetes sp.]
MIFSVIGFTKPRYKTLIITTYFEIWNKLIRYNLL